MKNITDRLFSLQGERSRRSFAQMLGVAEGTLRGYETGATSPNIQTLEKICKKLRINRRWLLLGEGEQGVEERGPPQAAVAESALNQPQVSALEEQIRNLTVRIAELECEKKQLERHSKALAAENKHVWEMRLSRDKDVEHLQKAAEHYQKTIDGLMAQQQALIQKMESGASAQPSLSFPENNNTPHEKTA